MKYKFLPIIIFLFVFIFFGGILVELSVYMRVRNANKRIEILRIVSIGKTKKEVVAYMGEPNHIEKNVKCKGARNCTALEYYSSGIYTKTKKTGPDDIKVVIDTNDEVVSIYYTDYPWEDEGYKAITGQ